MLAIARAIMANPKLLLLDEPSLGLAPKVKIEIFEAIKEIRERGTTTLLIEQDAVLAINNSDYILVVSINDTIINMQWFDTDYFLFYNDLLTENVGAYLFEIQIYLFTTTFNLSTAIPLSESQISYDVVPVGISLNLWNFISSGEGIITLAIVIGTSLQVQPFASVVNMLPAQVPRVLINRERTRQIFDLELLGDIEEIVAELRDRGQF